MTKIIRSFVMTCAIVCSAHKLHAQFVVSDVSAFGQRVGNTIVNTLQHVSRLTQLVAQVRETSKIYKEAKEWYDHLKKVANTVKQFKKVGECALLVSDIADAYVNAYSKFRMDPNFSMDEIAAIGAGYTKLIKESTRIFKEIDLGTKESDMSLTDKDRLDIIEKVYNELKDHKNLVIYFTRKMTCTSYIRSIDNKNMDVISKLYGLK
jgi:hypothetical protein